jgi:hypothetical protein
METFEVCAVTGARITSARMSRSAYRHHGVSPDNQIIDRCRLLPGASDVVRPPSGLWKPFVTWHVPKP